MAVCLTADFQSSHVIHVPFPDRCLNVKHIIRPLNKNRKTFKLVNFEAIFPYKGSLEQ